MFTGIIKYLADVHEVEATKQGTASITLAMPNEFLATCNIGDSIAVNGCCLTFNSSDGNLAGFDLSAHTLTHTVALVKGDKVHVEHSLRVGDQLGGHFVFGHVDAKTSVLEVNRSKDFASVTFNIPKEVDKRLLAKRGSVTIAGISLTVSELSKTTFNVELIPQTLAETIFGSEKGLEIGRQFNFEADYLARYAIRDC